MKRFGKNNIKAFALIGALAVAAAVYWYISGSGAPVFPTYTVERGDVSSTVSVSGQVLAEHNVSLSFQSSGQVARINVQEGATVAAGAVLASLDESSLQAALDQAEAGLSAARANLAILNQGATSQGIAVAEAQVQSAAAVLASAIRNAYASADDAVHNQTDPIFNNPRTDPQLSFPIGNQQLAINVQKERLVLESSLDDWRTDIGSLSSSSDLVSAAATATAVLTEEQSFLTDAATAVNLAPLGATLSQATVSGWKAAIAAGRTEVNSALAAVTAAASGLAVDQKQLVLKQAPPTPDQVAAAKAAVAQAQAAEADAEAALGHAVLVAPFAGSVSNLNLKVGQVVSAGAPVATLTNPEGVKFDVYLSQNDVARTQVGDPAAVTLDAYGAGVGFPAKVTSIAAASADVNGAPAYEVVLHFTNPDARIKDGMTGSADITVAAASGVVVVPNRLVFADGAEDFVLVRGLTGTKRQTVQTGLTGAGFTEITSGLAPGDRIIDF